tara:strand:+ start:872 stop:1156 length:285 start_codon:yes stop_codon:yes gene_type:complete
MKKSRQSVGKEQKLKALEGDPLMSKHSLRGGAEEGDNMQELLDEIRRTHELVEKLQTKYEQRLLWSKELQKSLKLNNTTEIKRLVNVEEKLAKN